MSLTSLAAQNIILSTAATSYLNPELILMAKICTLKTILDINVNLSFPLEAEFCILMYFLMFEIIKNKQNRG